jgi:cyclic-di-GMP phosphodiesterase TipF (flagellum assembly factor)
MRVLLNLVLLVCYVGLAGAVVVYGPRWVPWLDQALAFGIGAGVLVGCGLLHEIYARMGREIDLRHQLASLGHGYGTQEEELTWLRREVQTLRKALDKVSGPAQAGRAGRTVEEVMAEVKVLKSLIPRLVPDGPGALLTEPALTTGKPTAGGAISGALPPGFMPPVADHLEQEAILDIVRGALRNDRVDLVLQPIVSLPQRKRRFYECFSRLRTDGDAMIMPEQYISLAEGAGLITAIDNMLLFRCVQLVRRIHHRSENIDFFCNISPHTLADETFFGDFVDFLEGNQELASHLVFEFGQADFARGSKAGARLLDRLADLGCRFSLDRVSDLDFDPAELAARHDDVDFGPGFLFGEPRLARPAA